MKNNIIIFKGIKFYNYSFAKLFSIKGERLATGQSFNKETGELSAKNTVVIKILIKF